MKRQDVLKKKNSKEELVNVESVIKKDKANVSALRSQKELELIEVDDKIETYLKNEKLNLDDQFVTILLEKKSILEYVQILDTIQNDYL